MQVGIEPSCRNSPRTSVVLIPGVLIVPCGSLPGSGQVPSWLGSWGSSRGSSHGCLQGSLRGSSRRGPSARLIPLLYAGGGI
jgi:hypothetical protein